MNTQKTITAADILEQRDASRRVGLLAHSANVNGDFMARDGCSCYTCRDVLDPTGEVDALLANEKICPPSPISSLRIPVSVSLPSPIPSLRISTCPPAPARPAPPQKRTCSNSPHPPPPYPEFKPFCCQTTSPLHLPIPPKAHRQPSAESNTSALSPIVGLNSPDSFSFQFQINLRSPSHPPSRETTGVVDLCMNCEESMIPRLTRLLDQYKDLMDHIEKQYDEDLSHDEMAANDTWWTETDTKIHQTEKLLALLKKE